MRRGLRHRLFFFFAALFAVALCFTAPRLAAAEVQAHGLAFEHWVADTFFQKYRASGYTQKWDLPADIPRDLPPEFAGLPANPKAAKYGTPVGLGDALRQFDIAEPFILILGYWEQPDPNEKRFVKLLAPRIEPAAWRALWGPVTREDLEQLDTLIKRRDIDYREVRKLAQKMKASPPFNQAVFVLNPKIDSQGQRRLQCSLRFEDVFKYLAPGMDKAREETPSLWGVPFPGPVLSNPREFGPQTKR